MRNAHTCSLYTFAQKSLRFYGGTIKKFYVDFQPMITGRGNYTKTFSWFLLHKYIAYTYLGKYIIGRYLGGHFWCSDM